MSCVYWIHLPEHTNIFSEGYVGITCLDVQHRFKLHKQAKPRDGKKPTRLMYCIKKYGENLICETVLKGSREYCLYIENKLRPIKNLGWNLAIGGVAPMLGQKMSKESIEKSATKRRGAKRSKDVVENNKLRAIQQFKEYGEAWNHPHANKVAWALSPDLFLIFKSGITFGRRSVSKQFNIGADSAMKVVNKIKSGWVPSEDSGFMLWLDTYKQNKEAAINAQT